MRVGIDFDRVLFKTDEFKEKIENEIPGFSSTYQKALDENGVYSPQKHAEELEISVDKIMKMVGDTSEFLYKDVEQLEDVPGEFEIVLVSRGDPEFQRMKIENSGITDYFSEIVIVQEEPKDTVDIDFLVDDRRKEFERTDIPEKRTFLFDRSKNRLKEVIEWLKEFQ